MKLHFGSETYFNVEHVYIFMRLFIAIDIDDRLKDKIADLQKRFHGIDIKLVEKQNLHFCLKFLGEADESQINDIKAVIDKVAKQFEPFEINIAGLNAFPSKNYVKVVFLEVKKGREIMKAISYMLEELGKENRDFIPHLTLGRVKSGQGKEKLKKLLRELEDIEIGKMDVNEIRLIKSELTPSGPVYEKIFKSSL